MLEFKPGHPAHLALIEPHEHDRLVQRLYLSPQYIHYITQHFCISAWSNNRCIGIAGLLDLEDGNGLAWALLGKNSGKYMVQITNTVKRALDISHYPTIYMMACNDFVSAHRWAKMLGFRAEKHPIIDKQNRTLYVRGV